MAVRGLQYSYTFYTKNTDILNMRICHSKTMNMESVLILVHFRYFMVHVIMIHMSFLYAHLHKGKVVPALN
jgi:hypothetical protein